MFHETLVEHNNSKQHLIVASDRARSLFACNRLFRPTPGRLSMPLRKIEFLKNSDLQSIKPDFKKMLEYREENTLCVAITKKGPAPYNFSSRVFCPWVGIDEDPVTGSAHTVLGPYWSKKLGLRVMRVYQASDRGGEMDVRLRDDGRVDLIGRGRVVLSGELRLSETAR